jgi:hypothetical protein
MKHVARIGLAGICFVLTANFSSQESTMAREKPKVNFYGTFTDRQAISYDIENITINGMYRHIQLYEKPADAIIKPQDDVAKIDLIDIETIKLPNLEPMIKKYPENNGPEYIEIIVTKNDGKKTEHTYLIELSRKLWFDKKDGSDTDKEVSFKALGSITIKGCEQQTEKKPEKKCGDRATTTPPAV